MTARPALTPAVKSAQIRTEALKLEGKLRTRNAEHRVPHVRDVVWPVRNATLIRVLGNRWAQLSGSKATLKSSTYL